MAEEEGLSLVNKDDLNSIGRKGLNDAFEKAFGGLDDGSEAKETDKSKEVQKSYPEDKKSKEEPKSLDPSVEEPDVETPELPESAKQDPEWASSKKEEPKEVSTPEEEALDSMDLPESSSKIKRDQFSELKKVTKAFKAESKATKKILQSVLQKAGLEEEAKSINNLKVEEYEKFLTDISEKIIKPGDPTPEVAKELEDLRAMNRKVQLVNDPKWQEKYIKPVNETFRDIIEDVAKMFPDSENHKKWSDYCINKAGPNVANAKFWDDVLKAIPGELQKEKIKSKIVEFIKLRENADTQYAKASSQDGFKQYMEEASKTRADWYKAQVEKMVDLKVQKENLGDWALPRDASKAKNAEELNSINLHNTKQQRYHRFFIGALQSMQDPNRPDLHAQIAVDLVKGMRALEEVDDLKEELKRIKGELDDNKKDYEAVQKKRSLIANTNNKSVPPKKDTKKLNQDVRDVFKNYKWSE